MRVVRDLNELREARAALQGTVGFVPTMGALHDGHLSLMQLALSKADSLVVSIFVNPTQFGPNEDLDVYPRDLDGDLEKCRRMGASIVFCPSNETMYANGREQPTYVDVRELTTHLCGESRPNHFRGVTTVVTKLFNLVAPDVAVFGEKDYQQLATIRQMTEDLNFSIEIVGGPTVRESDGVALSSRNLNLSEDERPHARALSQGLALAWQAFRDGVRDGATLESIVRDRIASEPGVEVDYVACVHPRTLARYASTGAPIAGAGAVVACAAFLGSVRLIDNLRLDRELPDKIEISP